MDRQKYYEAVKANLDTNIFYHSLALDPDTLPEELEVLAHTEDGEIMAVGHKQYPVYGLQFHPESILTPQGPMMVENFLAL